jgi:uncharacterized phage protein gp47/JayE
MPITVTPPSFIGRSRREVADRLIERLPRLTDYTYTGEGSIVRALLETVAFEIANAYSLLEFSFAQQLVTQANGASLDSLGYLYGITRRNISSAQTQSSFYFYLSARANHQAGVPSATASVEFTIPAGTVVSMRDDIIGDAYSFTTQSNITFAQGDSVHYATLIPVNAQYSIDIAPHTLRVHDYDGTGYENLYCTNPVELSTSTIMESDDEYRARIVDGVRSIASANRIAVRLAALSINHVRDAKVVERPYGPGTLKVVIAVDTGATGNEVTLANTEVDKVRAAGTYSMVELATSVTVDINYGFLVTDTTSSAIIGKSIESAAKIYLASLGIGVPFRKSKLLAEMISAAPSAIDVYITSIRVNGATFLGDVYTIPPTSVIAAGTITNV